MYLEPGNQKSEQMFELRLAQTIYWCSSRADTTNPIHCLRTPAISPDIFERDRFSAVESVAIRREYESGFRTIKNVPTNLSEGRLLVYFPEINLYDGAAEDETHGFLDVNNLPGWDTWVAYFEIDSTKMEGSFLISWIPPEFVESVTNGIYVNPEECIMWLSDTDLNFAKELKNKGLLS